MIEIPCQFSKQSGPMSTGEHRITFDVQPEFASDLYKALTEWSVNPSGILMFKVVTHKETDKEKWIRYNRKIHSLFDEISGKKSEDVDTVKNTIKNRLIKEGKIKLSLNELTEEFQLEVIQRLERVLNDDD